MPKFSSEEIQALDDNAFRDLITEHMHPADGDPEAWDVLFSRELMSRTMEVLQSMLGQVTGSLTRKKAEAERFHLDTYQHGTKQDWFAYKTEYTEWRSRATAFQRMVQRRLGDAKNARRIWGQQRQTLQDQRIAQRGPDYKDRIDRARARGDEAHAVLQQVALKIREHQALTAVSGRTPEQHDYDLWRLLDELTLTVGRNGEKASVRRVMETYWLDTSPATISEGQHGQAERLMRQAPAGRSPRYEGIPKARHVGESERLA